MREKVIWLLAAGMAAAVFCPRGAGAADVSLRSRTILRGYQRDRATGKDLLALPLYEYLSVAYEDPEESGLSFHAGGWGRRNLGDRAAFDDNGAGELLYGYLDLRHGEVAMRLGRQDIFAAPASGAIDGARLSWKPGRYDVTVFAGLPVGLEGDGVSGDRTWGGRIGFSPATTVRAAASYRYVASHGHRDREEAAADIRWDLPGGATLTDRSTYSLKSRGFAEHDLELAAPWRDNRVMAGYQRIGYADFFAADDLTAAPFRYLRDEGGSLDIYRVGIDHSGEALETGAVVRYYDHTADSRDAFYGGVTASWHGDGLTQTGAEAGRMEGDDSRNSFTLLRAFTYYDRMEVAAMPVSLAADLVCALYDEKINDEDYSLFASMSAGIRLMDGALGIGVSVDYSIDPYYSHDLKSMLNATWQWQKNDEGEP